MADSTDNSINSSRSSQKLRIEESSGNTSSMLSDKSNNNKRKSKSYQCILEYELSNEAIERMKEPVGEYIYKYRFTKRGFMGTKDLLLSW